MAHQGSGVAAHTSKRLHVSPAYGRTGVTYATGPALYASYDAQAITGMTDGQALTAWPDVGGGGHNTACTASGTAYYSSTAANLINGHPAIRWPAQGTGATAPGVATFALTQPFSVVAVVKSQTASTGTYYLFQTAGAVVFQNASTTYSIYAGSVVGSVGTLDTSPHLIIGVWNGASSSITLDGATTSGLNPGANNMTGSLVLGSSGTGGGNFNWVGCIGQLDFYPSALTAGQQATIRTAMTAKWGTP